MNLYAETCKDLELKGFTPDDIHHIECHGENVLIDEFFEVAKTINYEPSDGSITIDPTLKICGQGWELRRYFTDGTEYWNISPITRDLPPTTICNVREAILNKE